MGLSNAMTGLLTLPGGLALDVASLSPLLDSSDESLQKYTAMGLPDPVAFAALTALGAIKDPMGMINAMMDAVQERIAKEEAALLREREKTTEAVTPGNALPLTGIPSGKSFVEAFQELQRTQQAGHGGASTARGSYAAAARGRANDGLGEAADSAELERLAKQAKEAAEQARVTRAAGTTTEASSAAAKKVAQVFVSTPDDEELDDTSKPAVQTLSSLLTGKASATSDGVSIVPGSQLGLEKVAISKLPSGTTVATLRLECARHGAVTFAHVDAETNVAYISFASSDMATLAVRRMNNKVGVCGSVEAVQARLISEFPEQVRAAAAGSFASISVPMEEPSVDPADLPEYLRPRKKSRSRSRRKRPSRSTRRRKRKSRSAKRWLDRSRSNSHTATGQYIRATGCSSTVRWWDKKREDSDTDRSTGSAKAKRIKKAEAEIAARRPRQVAVRGYWAQFVQSGTSYYYNIRSGQTVWDRPIEFEEPPSFRPTNSLL